MSRMDTDKPIKHLFWVKAYIRENPCNPWLMFFNLKTFKPLATDVTDGHG